MAARDLARRGSLMPDPLLETKLLLPCLRARTVVRPRLDSLLMRGADAAVTQISAPAGLGKTTMLGMWLAAGLGGRGVPGGSSPRPSGSR